MSKSRKHWRSLSEKAANGDPEDFEVILAHCLADLATGRATLEECYRRYAAHAERLRELLPLAGQEQAIPPPDHGTITALPLKQNTTAPLLPAEQSSTAILSPDQGVTTTLPPDHDSLRAYPKNQKCAKIAPGGALEWHILEKFAAVAPKPNGSDNDGSMFMAGCRINCGPCS